MCNQSIRLFNFQALLGLQKQFVQSVYFQSYLQLKTRQITTIQSNDQQAWP